MSIATNYKLDVAHLEKRKRNHYVLEFMGRFPQLTRAVPVLKKMEPHMATFFLNCSLIPFRVLSYFLADNGVQFMAKFFTSACAFLCVK